MVEFKLQFMVSRLVGGATRVNEGYGRKHYVAAFVQGRQIVHTSKGRHKRNVEAVEYAKRVVERYRSLAQYAILKFAESQHDAESTN